MTSASSTPATPLSPDSPAIAQHQAKVVRGQALPPGTPHVPAVIVGGGACGMTAGIRLRNAGIDCVVLERDAVPSGSTALSSGFVPAAVSGQAFQVGYLFHAMVAAIAGPDIYNGI